MYSSTAARLPLPHASSKNQRTRASFSCVDTICSPWSLQTTGTPYSQKGVWHIFQMSSFEGCANEMGKMYSSQKGQQAKLILSCHYVGSIEPNLYDAGLPSSRYVPLSTC